MDTSRHTNTDKKYYTQEVRLHSHITDVLPSKYESLNTKVLIDDDIVCNSCGSLLHAGHNECCETWVETEFGNFCTHCFKITDFMDCLENNLKK